MSLVEDALLRYDFRATLWLIGRAREDWERVRREHPHDVLSGVPQIVRLARYNLDEAIQTGAAARRRYEEGRRPPAEAMSADPSEYKAWVYIPGWSAGRRCTGHASGTQCGLVAGHPSPEHWADPREINAEATARRELAEKVLRSA